MHFPVRLFLICRHSSYLLDMNSVCCKYFLSLSCFYYHSMVFFCLVKDVKFYVVGIVRYFMPSCYNLDYLAQSYKHILL